MRFKAENIFLQGGLMASVAHGFVLKANPVPLGVDATTAINIGTH